MLASFRLLVGVVVAGAEAGVFLEETQVVEAAAGAAGKQVVVAEEVKVAEEGRAVVLDVATVLLAALMHKYLVK